ncbi:MAG TPA: hypothetical protein VG733_03470 [Chthoniobacteraceae bacterium]|nr:hypothetical protein [Chthoniobacteraceae bacterium]
MTTKPAISCVALLGLLSTGCSRHLSNENLHQVHDDMSIKEVESILGPPTTWDDHVQIPRQTTVKVTRYDYIQDGKTVELIFYDGKLVGGAGAITGTFAN